jgi:hypothetical protein
MRSIRAVHFSSLYLWVKLCFKHGRPQRVFHFDGGAGDQLLCRCLAAELSARGLKNNWFFSHCDTLLTGAPGVDLALPSNAELNRWLLLNGTPVHLLSYLNHDHILQRDDPPKQHLIAELCARAGLTGQVSLRPYFPVDGHGPEHVKTRLQVAIHSSCMNARYPIANKQWPVNRMQEVVDALSKLATVIQLGSKNDTLLLGAVDLRGVQLEEAALILKRSDVFVGMVGFLMHLARAVDCPGVIIYGGREEPTISGYSCNINISNKPHCSPCWLYSSCENDRKCLSEISPKQVVDACKTVFDSPPPRPLPHQTALIAECSVN